MFRTKYKTKYDLYIVICAACIVCKGTDTHTHSVLMYVEIVYLHKILYLYVILPVCFCYGNLRQHQFFFHSLSAILTLFDIFHSHHFAFAFVQFSYARLLVNSYINVLPTRSSYSVCLKKTNKKTNKNVRVLVCVCAAIVYHLKYIRAIASMYAHLLQTETTGKKGLFGPRE